MSSFVIEADVWGMTSSADTSQASLRPAFMILLAYLIQILLFAEKAKNLK